MVKITDIKDNIAKIIVGKDETIMHALVALVAGGHVLIEDAPGTGKTVLAKALSKSIKADFRRIQFTPDLLPSDVTGLNVYNAARGEFVFNEGPVFCNILLADEINRATPRTQAGLLECMEERQVTIDGVTRHLNKPFFVIATQNPIETSGTFPLPEAQLDRFLMKLSMGFPDKTQELKILDRFDRGDRTDAINSLNAVATPEDIEAMYAMAMEVEVSGPVREYIADIIMATRNRRDILSGVSPRGSLALFTCVKVLAFAKGRSYVTPEDVKELAIPVLAHRLTMAGGYGQSGDGRKAVAAILDEVKVPTEEL